MTDVQNEDARRRKNRPPTVRQNSSALPSVGAMPAATLAFAGAQEGRVAAVHPLVRGAACAVPGRRRALTVASPPTRRRCSLCATASSGATRARSASLARCWAGARRCAACRGGVPRPGVIPTPPSPALPTASPPTAQWRSRTAMRCLTTRAAARRVVGLVARRRALCGRRRPQL
jgi:hypothetical protein